MARLPAMLIGFLGLKPWLEEVGEVWKEVGKAQEVV